MSSNSQKRKLPSSTHALPPPSKTKKVRHITFNVGFTDYSTKPAYEQILAPNDSWWVGSDVQYVPKDIDFTYTMKEDEKLMWRLLNAGRSIVISGKAGAGKSHLLRRWVQHAEGSNFNFVLTGSTGVSAVNVGGITLHKALGLKLAQEPPTVLLDRIKKKPFWFKKTMKFLRDTDVLIIDEYSMVDPQFFNKIEYLFRKFRNSTKVFGGLQLILVGDLTQLPPIIPDNRKSNEHYVIDTEAYDRLKIGRMILTRSYRQNQDDPYLQLLNNIRVGKLTRVDINLIKSRQNLADSELERISRLLDSGNDINEPFIEPVDLYPYNKYVEKRNIERISQLVNQGAKRHVFRPFIKYERREFAPHIDNKDRQEAERIIDDDKYKSIRKMFPIFNLIVCENAQVMMRCNVFQDLGVVNGSLGIVQKITNDAITVLFAKGDGFMAKPLEIERYNFSVKLNATVKLVMVQFPLSIAYASSIHRAQGLTLDKARVMLKGCFAAGQLYTAMSRVRKIEDLSIMNFSSDSVLADKRAIDFETFNEHAEDRESDHESDQE